MQVHPATWVNAPAMQIELVGCYSEMTETTIETTTTKSSKISTTKRPSVGGMN